MMTRPPRLPVIALLLGLLLIVLVRTAWVSDDAFITFRTIDNFNHGYGLRWNVDERVQTYTHPLWMMLLAVLSRILPSLYYASIALSVALTMTAVWLLTTRLAATMAAAIVAVTVLAFSRSFIDYSSSGLENPLTHLLLVAFFALYFSAPLTKRQRVLIGAVAGLALLNRLDTALLIAPALAATWIRDRRHLGISVLAAALPVVAWEIFSLIYYGFLFPNTVYAKLQTGIPAGELVAHGWMYLKDSFANDPLTLTAIVGVAACSLVMRRRRDWPVLAGIGLFVGVFVRAGGDFMTGRLLSAPLVCAAILLSRFEFIDSDRQSLALCAAAMALGLAAPRPAVWSNSASTDTRIAPSGIADERLFYQQMTGLLLAPWRGQHPAPLQAEDVAAARRAGRHSVALTQIGLYGFHAGPDMHIIDPLGLGDPLLARLPAAAGWRVGHYRRDLPAGYAESVENGVNTIRDPATAAYYERLRVITRGPLWSARRLRIIARENFHW